MIRFKIISIILLSVFLLLVTLSFVSYEILGRMFADIERGLMLKNLTRADGTLQNTRTALNIKLRDWAQWDDTYWFIQNKNPEYIASNLAITTPANLEINLMLFVNQEGEVVHFSYIDFVEPAPLPEEGILSEIMRYRDVLFATSTESNASGIISYQDSLLLIEALPIVQTDGSEPVVGTILFGRHIDALMLKSLKQLTQLSLTFFPYDGVGLPEDVLSARNTLDSTTAYLPRPLSSDTYAGYFLLHDLRGTPVSIVRAETTREVFATGKKSVILLVSVSAVSVVVVGLAILLLVERVLLRSFTRLIEEVSRVSVNDLASARVSVRRNDEVGVLAQKINTMFSEVARAQEQERNAHRLIVEASEKTRRSLEDSERINKIMVNRELKMIELKKTIAELEERINRTSNT